MTCCVASTLCVFNALTLNPAFPPNSNYFRVSQLSSVWRIKYYVRTIETQVCTRVCNHVKWCESKFTCIPLLLLFIWGLRAKAFFRANRGDYVMQFRIHNRPQILWETLYQYHFTEYSISYQNNLVKFGGPDIVVNRGKYMNVDGTNYAVPSFQIL